MKTALYDIETNGLLVAKRERDGSLHPPMDRVHCISIIERETGDKTTVRISAADQVGYEEGAEGRGFIRLPIEAALTRLMEADLRVGHNSQDFDERALAQTYPAFRPARIPCSTRLLSGISRQAILDTLVLSRCIYPDIAKSGPNTYKLPGWMKQAHGLKAWGLRLGEHKGDYKGGWLEWSDEMQDYMEQDTVVLELLFKWLMSQKPAQEMVELEHCFAEIIRRQETRGFAFDYDKAVILAAELQEVATRLEADLIETFGEWWEAGKPASSNAVPFSSDDYQARELEEDEDLEDEEEQARRRQSWLAIQSTAGVIVPAKTREVKMVGVPNIRVPRFGKTGKRLADYVGPPKIVYTQGSPFTPIKRVQFKPGSRTHIIKRLKLQFGWEPLKFTKKTAKGGGCSPIVDDDVLRGLPWPEAQKLADYFLVLKRIGQIATGKKAWLKVAIEYPRRGLPSVWRIHGRVNTNGAVTGRCTHSDPNLAQVPKNTAEEKNPLECVKGWRCRELFIAGPGYDLVGFDGAALELRMLAHYVFPWDGGEYARIVHEGRKEDRTDPHSWLCLLIGEDLLGLVGGEGRDHAKTVMYADLYGAGDLKRGAIVEPHATEQRKRSLGREIAEKMAGNFLAKAELQKAITNAVEDKGFLKGLDKRVLRVRKAHAALNTLLQSAGAVVMKLALVVLDHRLQAAGLVPGRDYEFVANIHDEAQAEVLPEHVPLFKELAEAAMVEAGERLRLKCPLKAEASHGDSWRKTH